MLRRHAWVMDAVELGLMSRMEIGRVEVPFTDGRFEDAMAMVARSLKGWSKLLLQWCHDLLSVGCGRHQVYAICRRTK